MATVASSFLDDFTSTLPKDEEEDDFVVSTEGKSGAGSTAVTDEATSKDTTTNTQDFLKSFTSSSDQAGSTTPAVTKETTAVAEDQVEEGSPISTAQKSLDRLLSQIRSQAEEAQQAVVSDLESAAPKLATGTEEYEQLQKTVNQYFGGNIEDITGIGGLQSTGPTGEGAVDALAGPAQSSAGGLPQIPGGTGTGGDVLAGPAKDYAGGLPQSVGVTGTGGVALAAGPAKDYAGGLPQILDTGLGGATIINPRERPNLWLPDGTLYKMQPGDNVINNVLVKADGGLVNISRDSRFLDAYIAQVSSAASTKAQQKLGGLLGKSVVASSPQESIVDTFRQNLGNAQARTAALAQQAGNSALANTSKYTQPVESSATKGTYTPTQTPTASKPTGFTGSASNTSVAPTQSSPTPPNVSMLGQKAQQNLERTTGITAQKEAVNAQLESFKKNILDYSGASNAQNTLGRSDDVYSSLNETFENISKVLPEQQQADFYKVLTERLTQSAEQVSQLGTPAYNFLKHVIGANQPQTELTLPADLTNKIRDYLLNKPEVQALKPGQAFNVDLQYTPGMETAAGLAFGKGVVYKDPDTGALHFTESIDAQGKNTNQNANKQGVGTWSGESGAYFFNKFTDPSTGKASYDVDAAAGGPIGKFILENAPDKAPFDVNLDLSDPSKFGKQNTLDGIKGIFENAFDRAKDAFEGFTEGAKGAVEGGAEAASEAQAILQEYLDKIQNPWQEDPDISSKEWKLSGMWSGEPRYLSTEEVMNMPDYAYGSHSLASIKKAMSEFPDWKPSERISAYLAENKRPPFPFSLPVKHKFSRDLDKIRDGGTLTSGPVWFQSYLSRNEKLKGINSKNEAEFEAEKKAIAQRNALGDLFEGFLNMIKNAAKQVDWNSALNNFARSADRIVGY